ncbi:hypothetical protein EBESD8_4560 [Rhodococcus aetherivorans]|nr:hypothetical protein EBESD8_4560 [Rhodococcus aetherivorans]
MLPGGTEHGPVEHGQLEGSVCDRVMQSRPVSPPRQGR